MNNNLTYVVLLYVAQCIVGEGRDGGCRLRCFTYLQAALSSRFLGTIEASRYFLALYIHCKCDPQRGQGSPVLMGIHLEPVTPLLLRGCNSDNPFQWTSNMSATALICAIPFIHRISLLLYLISSCFAVCKMLP